MFVILTTINTAKSTELKVCLNTDDILYALENPTDPATTIIKFRDNTLPTGIVKGSFKEICEVINPYFKGKK